MSLDKSFSSEASSRYALALFEVVKESSELDIVETKAKELLNIYKSNKDLENFIKNPTQSFQTQAKVIKDLSNLMKFPKNLSNFLSLLVFKRRIFFLEKIILSFIKLISKERGELTASLISSKELSKEELGKISSELSNSIGSAISFDYKVDKNLIGGLKIQLGSLMIDSSIKNKLRKYEQLMLEN
jgi:F-type H+-transporting ATPase subunit delta